ncbi:MAG: sugar transferase, partial [Thermomicrobiaceae bacterium]
MSRDGAQARVEQAGSRVASREAVRPRDYSHDRLVSSLFQASLFLLDVLLIAAGLIAAWWIPERFNLFALRTDINTTELGTAMGIGVIAILATFIFGGMYRLGRGTSRVDEFYKVCMYLTLGAIFGLTAAVLILGPDVVISRRVILLGWLLAIIAVAAGRLLHGSLVGSLRARGMALRRLLIVGTQPTGRTLLENVQSTPHLGYEVVGFLAHREDENAPREFAGMPVYGTTARIAEVTRRHEVDEIIIAPEGIGHNEMIELVYQLMDQPVNIKVYPDTFRLITNDELSISDLGGLPMVSVRNVGLRALDRSLKRSMDILISSSVLIFLSPLMLLLAVAVKVGSRGPVFFVQERVGHDGIPFNLLK